MQVVGDQAIVTRRNARRRRWGSRRLAQRDRSQVEARPASPSIWTTRDSSVRPSSSHPACSRSTWASGLVSSRGSSARCGGAHRSRACAGARAEDRSDRPARAANRAASGPPALEDFDQPIRTSLQQVDVVEHEHERQRPVGENVAEPGQANAREVGLRHRQRARTSAGRAARPCRARARRTRETPTDRCPPR